MKQLSFKIIISLFLGFSQTLSQVIITEVMYDPDSTNSEFVELFNISDSTVNLTGWTIGDEKDADVLKIVDSL
ncbi:lamin tail domain-containing protein [bacterium]|nr:lamin tail domain-containing protein [bacterium]